ncbi:hypothetical protein H0H93_014631 [Arthromyces matolae]|nr:hypothetical protein H0H93_014631 [Arthromyces matolae]
MVTEIDRIEKLPRADHASYDQDRIKRCHPGTRVDILANLHSWAIDNSSPSVYWLNGHAGSGKSTIAHSFCSKADTDGTLGASFFCSRDEAALSNLQTIFPTLSFQLAVRYPIFRSYVAKALKEDPTLGNRSLSTQLVRLLVGPLEYSSISTVLVIDALDECRDLEPVSAILSLLSGHVERIPNVKWLITGRPEDHIRTGFDIPSLRSLTKSFILHDVAVLDVNKDIALYLRASLSEGVKRRRAYIVPIPWPEEKDLETLTRQCDGLFIFASTAVMYIFSSYYDPQDRLKDLCRSDHGILSEHGQYGLDCLYAAVLEEAYNALRFRPTDKAAKRALTMLMSAIALSFDPLTSDDLADLLNTKSATIMSLLCHLHAVIKVPVLDCHPISLYHKSFFDYVTDGSRCTNVVYYVNPDTQHCLLAEQCLQLMNSRLRRNPCDLPRYSMNSDLDLKERRKRIGGALVYACTYWISHLCEGKISQKAIDLLEIFVSKRLVQWMEVMSLVDRFSSVISGLHKIHDALSTSSFNDVGQIQKLLDVIYDGRKFASEFRPAVQASASHLYHSALPFAPDASVIRQMHVADIVSEAKVTYGKPSAWEVHDTEIYDKATPRRQAFSNDGKMICVHYASRFQQTSCVFDVATGERLHTFQGTGICFSPDSRTAAVAVGDKSAKIWDLQTGAVRAIINPDEYSPYSYQEGGNCALAFSPSGKYLLIPSKDQMQVWDVSTGEMMWTTTRDDMPPSTLCSTSPNQEPPSEDFCPDRLAWLQEEPPLVVVRHYRYCLAIHNFADRSVTRVFDVPDSGVNDCYYEFFFGLSVKHGILGISDEGILYLRNPYTNQLYGTIEGKRAGSVTFSDHLPIMLFIGEFYDISNPRSPRRLKTEPRYYSRPVFSPTQSLIATVATPYIYIFPLAACFDMESCDASTPFETVGALGQSYQRLLSVSEDAKEVLYIVWQPKATKLHLGDDGITETEVQINLGMPSPVVFAPLIVPVPI